MSYPNGGETPDHNSHENGLDWDNLYLGTGPSGWVQSIADPNYDRERTGQIMEHVIQMGGVNAIFTADSVLANEIGYPVLYEASETNCFHVRFNNPNPPQ